MSASMLSGQEALNHEVHPEVIIPYPYSSNIEVDSSGQLSPMLSRLSAMSIDAAVTAWHAHPEAKILIPGESLYGEDLPTTSDLMVERAKSISEITDESLWPMYTLSRSRGLNNTYLQTRALKEFAGNNDLENSLVVALGYHAPRVLRALGSFGLKPNLVVAEEVLKEVGITDYDQYLPIIAELKKTELLARIMTAAPGTQKGIIPNVLMKYIGPRIVDVVEGEDSQLKLEDEFAHKKKTHLIRALGGVKQTRAA